jgi:nicotinamide mononucleotide adenylyltransferase
VIVACFQLNLIFGTIGVVVIERVGLDLTPVIAQSPILSKYQANIDIVPQRITNTISSTSVRNLIKTQQSVRFLTPDKVIDYIHQNKLYGHDPSKHPKPEYLEPKI